MWGCARLLDQLKLKDVSASIPAIQKILIQKELGAKRQPLLRLEEKDLKDKIPLTPEQVKAIEKANQEKFFRSMMSAAFFDSIKTLKKDLNK